ncbi:Xanthine permease [Klebsiella pneumoniae IS53]|nr:Xanthine permease [Klebsiella pneumoniae IS53]
MSDEHHSGLLYGLEQRIPPLPAFFSALQHVLAGLVGIITPPLIIGATLGLGDWLPYLISMSLLASGIGTFSAVQSGMGHRRRDDLHAGHQFLPFSA